MFHGMMTIYKEAGYTSSDVVSRLRGILHMKKIGHTGTLDPDAEGVLPVCLGNGTKLCELIADRDKEYAAVMRLGTVTDTQDMSGEVLSQISDEEVAGMVTEADILKAASDFTGKISQIPPMYSAVKVGGKRLYQLARQGRTIDRPAREVTIHELTVTDVQLPLVTMRVRCSKGTYIRTLCQDIGEKLGTGGTMESLLRTRVGSFTLPGVYPARRQLFCGCSLRNSEEGRGQGPSQREYGKTLPDGPSAREGKNRCQDV